MNRSFSGKRDTPGSLTDRTRAKSNDRDIKPRTFTREIVIKTE